ncbi:D-alanyl-D-alanine carboxypeptidase [Streptomyces cavernae]|uniref:D-alanyl-D-alanine carboxypeptidase n=1 Tax=Streptomyces cavernae TaxID=2259034 RepID=UPI000FEB64E4|nr:D-alanyl-D-alanine carboxypeptidase [Streptomyces cavernae]
MAGESPDRSKQHEPSAEPTRGNASAVPAHSDPRLAVARESVAAAARVDQATAVFSTRALVSADDESDPEAASDSVSDTDPGAAPASARFAAKLPTEGDARLRAAVAAWVASADDAEGAEATEGVGGSDGPQTADEAESADEAEAVTEPEGSEGLGEPENAGEPEDAGEPEGAVEPEDAAEADEAEEPDEPDHSEDLDDAGDVDVAGAVDDAEEDAEESANAEARPVGESDESGEPGDSDGSGESGESDESVGSGESDESGEADGLAESDESEKTDEPAEMGESGEVVDSGASEDAVTDPRTTESSDLSKEEDDTDAESGGRSDAESDSDGGPDAESDSDGGPDAESDSDGGPDAESDSDGGPDAESGGEPDVEPEADAEAEGETEGETDGESGPEDKPVDQPTAVFKTPRRVVDQPTTMLKLGDAKSEPDDKPAGKASGEAPAEDGGGGEGEETPKSEDKDKGEAKGKGDEKPKVESDSERTSKFVALKSLDEPQTRPKPPAQVQNTPPPAAPRASSTQTTAIPQVGPERTAQQPLPPKPPLDLLAELTNTPETPVRTLVRRVKIWTPLVILLAVIFATVQALRPLPTPSLTLTAAGTHAFKGDKVQLPWPGEGQGWLDVNGIGTMDNFGEQKPVAIGSVAKAMTAYLILKDHPMKPGEGGAKIEVDAKAEAEGKLDEKEKESTLNTVKEGDVLTEKDAIAAIMIPSANNIARLLARWDAGSEAAFVKKMNAAAKELGMKNTKYTDPSGLMETTVSTAEDQVKLGNELVNMPALTDITKLPSWVDPSGTKWRNWNQLVPYNGAIGIKTGTTTKAGGNLLFAATKDVGGETVTVVGAILGQHEAPIIDTVIRVSKDAMIAARDVLTSEKILSKGDVVGYVDNGLGGRTPVVVTKDVSAVGWAGQTVKLTLADGGETIPQSAAAGTKVGVLDVGDGTGDAVEVPVALKSEMTEPGFGAKLTRVS